MPGWVQFDRPQRCWFWLLYSCVHKCAALAYFTLTDTACTTPARQAGDCGWHPSVLQAASSRKPKIVQVPKSSKRGRNRPRGLRK